MLHTCCSLYTFLPSWIFATTPQQVPFRRGSRLREDKTLAWNHTPNYGITPAGLNSSEFLPSALAVSYLRQILLGIFNEQEFPVVCHFVFGYAKPRLSLGDAEFLFQQVFTDCLQYIVLHATQEPHI